MTRDEFRDEQFRISVIAGMNQRYHQARVGFWSRWDRVIRIVVALLAVAGFTLATMALVVETSSLDLSAVVVAGLAAFGAVVLNVVPLGNEELRHQDLFRRWTDLREDTDALLFDLNGRVTAAQVSQLKVLDAKVHRICGAEPARSRKLWSRCEREERNSRGIQETADQQDDG